MSRLPPVPPASMPVHGPEGVAKTSVDVSHRVRSVRRQVDLRNDAEAGTAPISDFGWTVVAALAALGLGYWAGRRFA